MIFLKKPNTLLPMFVIQEFPYVAKRFQPLFYLLVTIVAFKT